MEPEWILSYLMLGSFVGFFAGLLGVGGGGLLVPILSTLFLLQGEPSSRVIHLSLGTSMACMIVTSFSSMRAHNRKNTIHWQIVRFMCIGVIIGTFGASHLVSFVEAVYISVFFSAFMFYTALNMLKRKNDYSPQSRLNNIKLVISGTWIGAISALVSIGGGSLTVPFLVKNNIKTKEAIATSAAMGFPIAVAGTCGYALSGWNAQTTFEYSIGFIYLPAVILISLTGFIMAPIGVRAAHILKTETLKKIFALMLVLLSFKMFWLSIT